MIKHHSEETKNKLRVYALNRWKNGKYTSESRYKMGSSSRGKHHSEEHRKNLAAKKLGNENPNWKGDDVGRIALHDWIKYRLPKPVFCQRCNKRKAYDLANKGEYIRDLNQWEWLCRKCHMNEDGRLIKLHNSWRDWLKDFREYKLSKI